MPKVPEELDPSVADSYIEARTSDSNEIDYVYDCGIKIINSIEPNQLSIEQTEENFNRGTNYIKTAAELYRFAGKDEEVEATYTILIRLYETIADQIFDVAEFHLNSNNPACLDYFKFADALYEDTLNIRKVIDVKAAMALHLSRLFVYERMATADEANKNTYYRNIKDYIKLHDLYELNDDMPILLRNERGQNTKLLDEYMELVSKLENSVDKKRKRLSESESPPQEREAPAADRLRFLNNPAKKTKPDGIDPFISALDDMANYPGVHLNNELASTIILEFALFISNSDNPQVIQSTETIYQASATLGNKTAMIELDQFRRRHPELRLLELQSATDTAETARFNTLDNIERNGLLIYLKDFCAEILENLKMSPSGKNSKNYSRFLYALGVGFTTENIALPSSVDRKAVAYLFISKAAELHYAKAESWVAAYEHRPQARR